MTVFIDVVRKHLVSLTQYDYGCKLFLPKKIFIFLIKHTACDMYKEDSVKLLLILMLLSDLHVR
jgi:hypothetical protein